MTSFLFILFVQVSLIFSSFAPVQATERDSAFYQEKLQSEQGLELSIHASVSELSQFVVTFRNPENFFDFDHFPLIADSRAVFLQLQRLKRYDRIRIWGRLEERPNSQTHLFAQRLEIIKVDESVLPPFDRDLTVPDDLLEKSEVIAKVHAIAAEGKILVLDHRGVIVPLIVPVNLVGWSQALYRGDKVKVNYKVQKEPLRPVHLILDGAQSEPIKVLESALELHGQPVEYSGSLVLYQKSPQISLDIFALRVDLGDDVHLDFTLVNFENSELFFELLERLKEVWHQSPESPENGRNNLHKSSIRLMVKGVGNVSDPNQANPQILIYSLNDIELL